MFETFCLVATMLTGFCTAGCVIYDRIGLRSPVLRYSSFTPCPEKGIAHLALTLGAGPTYALVTEMSCPGYKIHRAPSTFTGFSLASLEDFTDSLTLTEGFEPGSPSRTISILISPIPEQAFSIILRKREWPHTSIIKVNSLSMSTKMRQES